MHPLAGRAVHFFAERLHCPRWVFWHVEVGQFSSWPTAQKGWRLGLLRAPTRLNFQAGQGLLLDRHLLWIRPCSEHLGTQAQKVARAAALGALEFLQACLAPHFLAVLLAADVLRVVQAPIGQRRRCVLLRRYCCQLTQQRPAPRALQTHWLSENLYPAPMQRHTGPAPLRRLSSLVTNARVHSALLELSIRVLLRPRLARPSASERPVDPPGRLAFARRRWRLHQGPPSLSWPWPMCLNHPAAKPPCRCQARCQSEPLKTSSCARPWPKPTRHHRLVTASL